MKNQNFQQWGSRDHGLLCDALEVDVWITETQGPQSTVHRVVSHGRPVGVTLSVSGDSLLNLML